MEANKKFSTKGGFCHITDDKIILTHEDTLTNVATLKTENTIYRILILYSIIAAGLLFFSIDYFKSKDFLIAFILIFLALYIIYGLLTSLNNSTTPIIDRKKIQRVIFKKGFTGFSSPRFEVYFENNSGKIRKRLILMPGSFAGGKTEIETAYTIMTEEKLL